MARKHNQHRRHRLRARAARATGLIAATLAASALAGLSACSSSTSHPAYQQPAPPPVPQTYAFDTTQILEQAREPAETAQPYAVNNGALTITDTSDTTQPISVNFP